jgi:hypothetical protein
MVPKACNIQGSFISFFFKAWFPVFDNPDANFLLKNFFTLIVLYSFILKILQPHNVEIIAIIPKLLEQKVDSSMRLNVFSS